MPVHTDLDANKGHKGTKYPKNFKQNYLTDNFLHFLKNVDPWINCLTRESMLGKIFNLLLHKQFIFISFYQYIESLFYYFNLK